MGGPITTIVKNSRHHSHRHASHTSQLLVSDELDLAAVLMILSVCNVPLFRSMHITSDTEYYARIGIATRPRYIASLPRSTHDVFIPSAHISSGISILLRTIDGTQPKTSS